MTNLIPPDAKKAVRKEYWVRVCSVWAFLLSGVLAAFSFLTVPTYMLYQSQINNLEQTEAQIQNGSKEAYNDALEAVTRANEIAEQLSQEPGVIKASELLGAVESAQSEAIQLNRFSYGRTSERVESIELSGIARDRSSLAAFADALKAEPLFVEADVPVSSLVREQQLPFTLTVDVIQED